MVSCSNVYGVLLCVGGEGVVVKYPSDKRKRKLLKSDLLKQFSRHFWTKALIKNDNQSFSIKNLFSGPSKLENAQQMIGLFTMVVSYYIRIFSSKCYNYSWCHFAMNQNKQLLFSVKINFQPAFLLKNTTAFLQSNYEPM